MEETAKTIEKETGSISVHTENIFPIIKKFLYSDHEIFLRELVSNAVDATQKLKLLASSGKLEEDLGDIKIRVELDVENKTLTIKDSGIGLTADEVRKYINQVAFSGAEEFLKKIKGSTDKRSEIIGQFGLGFYSAFMVADKVEIVSKSWVKSKPGVLWECDGSTNYSLEKNSRKERGTDIILHISEDSAEFLDKARIETLLKKYCAFLPVEIEFDGKVINNPNPIWKKPATELKDEDYLNFYKELYPFQEDPLFWIHLNVDYPFNLTGILYFPKVRKEFEVKKDRIKLFSRQVFITDQVKDIVPEYLMLLEGVIDSPDIPLNVSRSFLQSDSNVKKISNYISRKAADKLAEIFREDRDGFEKKWDDIGLFVKYGMLSDETFFDKSKDFCLLVNNEKDFFTFEEYKEKIKEKQTDKTGNLVYLYTTNQDEQDAFILPVIQKGYDVLVLDGVLDSHFTGLLERKIEKSSWKRVDSETLAKLIEKEGEETPEVSETEKTLLSDLFKSVTPDPMMNVEVQSLSENDFPVTVLKPEFFRRMKEMNAMSGMSKQDFPDYVTVVVNGNHSIVKKIALEGNEETRKELAKQCLDLGLLSQGMLKGNSLTEFIRRSLKGLE